MVEDSVHGSVGHGSAGHGSVLHNSVGSVDEASLILEAAEAHDGAPPVSDQALLAVQQGERTLTLFSIGGSATPVAVGIVGEGEVDLVVHPESRGQGIGTAALRELLEEAGSEPVRAWAHGENPAADALLARAGFTPVRSLFRMALDPAKLPAAHDEHSAYSAPTGFAIRPFNPDSPADAAAWVRVNAAAFATHPEQGRITEADFALQRAEPWFDANDLLLLEAEDADGAGRAETLAGSTWIKTVRRSDADSTSGAAANTVSTSGDASHVETELYAIGVDPIYAGRGLGRVLLGATLARMAAHRPDRVTLYVDGENERAVNMYLAAGFEIDSRSKQWLRGARIGA